MTDTSQRPEDQALPSSVAVLAAAMWPEAAHGEMIDRARASWAKEIVAALEAAGYAIVPLEPDSAQLDAGTVAANPDVHLFSADARKVYRAMVGQWRHGGPQ